jgi:UDP-3-O-[3-hydroxymyristoyl] glucosamine N-acyltransferase
VALRLDEIVARFGGELVGAGDTVISRIGTLEGAEPGDLAFLANPEVSPSTWRLLVPRP